MLGGLIEQVTINTAVAVFFWLQFYFIWIGVQWVRWLQGAFSIIVGFAMLIWGFEGSSTVLLVIGTYNFFTGAYVGFAPAVHFFAQRQRERRDLKYALLVGIVFLLLLASRPRDSLACLPTASSCRIRRGSSPIFRSANYSASTTRTFCSTM